MQAEMAGVLSTHFRHETRVAQLIGRTMDALPERPPQDFSRDTTIDNVMDRISGPRERLTHIEKQRRQQTVCEEFALRSSLETQAQMRKIPRFGRWMSFAALLAMAAAPLMLFKLAVTLHTIAAVPILRPITGNVYVISQDSKPSLERSAKETLSASDGIAVDSRARAAVTYWDGTRMELSGADGRLWMSKRASATRPPQRASDDDDKRLLLESGTLSVTAAKQHADQPLVLVTPHAEVEVIGTRFVLDVGADETRVTVYEGTVRFIRAKDRRSISVSADEYAVAAPSTELVARSLHTQ
jgi:hypothetical protein